MSKVIYDRPTKESFDTENELHEEQFDVTEQVNESLDDKDVETITLKSSSVGTIETIPTQFSDVSDNKVRFSDFYHDARSFLDKANSTKFILIAYLMLSIPALLLYGYISEDVYREMVIILAITYLGVDVYEKKSLVKNKNKLPQKE